jgi:hypothetical protein
LDEDFVSVTKDQRTKPIPFGFENPLSGRRKFGYAFGKHRQDGRINR